MAPAPHVAAAACAPPGWVGHARSCCFSGGGSDGALTSSCFVSRLLRAWSISRSDGLSAGGCGELLGRHHHWRFGALVGCLRTIATVRPTTDTRGDGPEEGLLGRRGGRASST
jgi:hypothetical protein